MTLRIPAEGKTASKQGKFVSRHVKGVVSVGLRFGVTTAVGGI